MECGPEMKGVKSRLVNNIYNRAFLATHLFCFSMNQLYKSTLLKFCSQKNILFLITQLVMQVIMTLSKCYSINSVNSAAWHYKIGPYDAKVF